MQKQAVKSRPTTTAKANSDTSNQIQKNSAPYGSAVFLFLAYACVYYIDRIFPAEELRAQAEPPLFLFRNKQKGHGAESVVTGNHSGVRVFHPPVVKITAATGKFFNEETHTFPCAVAKSFRLPCVYAEENLSFAQVAGMFYLVFVYCRQVGVAGFSYYRYFNLFYCFISTTV